MVGDHIVFTLRNRIELFHMCNIMEAVKIENTSSFIFCQNINSTLRKFCEGETGPEQIQFVEENSVEDTCWQNSQISGPAPVGNFADFCRTN